MGKSLYTFYKERLVEIGGTNRCLYLKGIVRRNAYDLGRILEAREEKVAEFSDFLWGKSNKYAINILSKEEGDEIAANVEAHSGRGKAQTEPIAPEDDPDGSIAKKRNKIRVGEITSILEEEVARVKDLCREVEEIERETGRRELYIGYPFVFGCIPQGSTKTHIKAPLLLFPVKVNILDNYTVEFRPDKDEPVRINHALVYAYAHSKKLNIDPLELEYDNIGDAFDSVKDVVDYLERGGIKISGAFTKNILSYNKFKEPEGKNELSLRSAAVLSRFPLSNSIYSDYTVLEKKKLSNDALSELLRTDKKKEIRRQKVEKKRRLKTKSTNNYIVKMLDYAQANVVRKVEENGNMVIYGPPGTGKSQTIVNIIANAMAKNKRVLVVSQKRAALDVVYNRLGPLTEKAMYINDESKEKRAFYEKCLAAHTKNFEEPLADVEAIEAEFDEIEGKIATEVKNLEAMYNTMNSPRMPFGLSLTEMYTSSRNISKDTPEHAIHTAMVERPDILKLTYKELSDALFGIHDMKLSDTYFDFMQAKEKNPLIDNMLPDLDILTLSEVKGQLEAVTKGRRILFNTAKYPYYRQVLAYYPLLEDERNLLTVVKVATRFEKPGLFKKRKTQENIKAQFIETMEAVKAYASVYDCLHRVLTEDGYIAVIDNVLRGNLAYVKLVYEALDSYISQRDTSSMLAGIGDAQLAVMDFAYSISKGRSNYNDTISRIMPVRIYHEVLKYEDEAQAELAQLVDFENVAAKIYKLKEAQLDVAMKLCVSKNNKDYETVYDESSETNKDYLYQISKKQKFWPIRKTLGLYSDFVLALFPCWLLSPENVSCLLPLTKNMFDIVIFDEASQVFIENTIPTIYRGKTVVVAGDDKQLRPSATFVKRYLGADAETQEDYSVQAALEVSSLLDLAVSRYESANLTYHYRSKSQELIDFSNAAFYSSALCIAPNTSKNDDDKPIVRYKVDGKWINRKNEVEADRVVDALAEIFKTRKENESIGIITFNAEQQSLIADRIDERCSKDAEFRSAMLVETHRSENGEDTGIFVKNLENVQGDERDIIIFSIGYAPGESGKVYTAFGSLSAEGGENRLNVAITRAKKRVIVVTSIEPEDLKVEGSKNQGPKLLQKYLKYVRAVSDGKRREIAAILSELSPDERPTDTPQLQRIDMASEMKEKLEKHGYKVDLNLGTKNSRISLAVMDPETKKYLVGVELDYDAYDTSDSAIERDVYKPRFLADRGWTVERVWCRDWWLSPARVIRSIISIAEKNKKNVK